MMSEDLKKRILVVDDNLESRKLFKEILEYAGYEVVIVQEGDDALEYLSSDQDFDLIITDMLMPFMTGIELAEKLKSYRETKNIPILGTSAHFREKQDIMVDDFISKPVDNNLLLEKVKRLVQ
jgi:CheY-like chemotaxis protein